MRAAATGLVLVALLAGGVQAEMGAEPGPFPRPLPRPATAQMTAPLADVPRPLPRPAALSAPPATVALPDPRLAAFRPRPRPPGLASGTAPPALVMADPALAAFRPKPRPDLLLASAAAAPQKRAGLAALFGPKTAQSAPAAPTKGYVCDDPDIKGEALAPITSSVKGCGVAEPVRVSSVDGVRLRGDATIDCTTAKALKTWIDRGMRPAFVKQVVELRIAGSYVCRPRNNVKGNKISEHGHGKAIDIAAFVFEDGREWTVKQDYNRQIRKAQKAACGIFGTTLGPGSDGYHEDHLHFDTAGYRSGPYCR